MYKVTEDDLIGQLEGFPIEVVQAMIERQVEQGNPADVSVFQEDAGATYSENGFYWTDTEDLHSDEGDDFWEEVICERNFDLFFEVYPKETSTQDPVSEKPKEVSSVVTEKKVKPETKKAVDKKEKRRASFRHLLN